MATGVIFRPPYLQYSAPADLLKIQARIKTLAGLAMRTRPDAHMAVNRANVSSNLVTPNDALSATPASKGGAGTSRAASGPKAGTGRGSATVSPSASTGRGSRITVTPNGTVPLGFNCNQKFEASMPYAAAYVTHIAWNLLMQDQQSGLFDQIFFMGGTSVLTSSPAGKIEFYHDFSTYRNSAYTSSNQTAVFAVQCVPHLLWDALAPDQSDPITLDFTPQSCVGIHSVSLSASSVTGGDNGTEPVLTVILDAPAGPGGQEVTLGVDNDNLGRIMGSGKFVIAQGETQGSQGWFLGTRRVYTTGKSFNVVTELTSPGGRTGRIYSNVKLTKQ